MTYIAVPNAIGFVLDESQQVVTWGKECPNPSIVAPISEKALQKLSEGAPAHWDSTLSKIVVGDVPPPPPPAPPEPTAEENLEIRTLARKSEATHLRRTKYMEIIGKQLELLCDYVVSQNPDSESPGGQLVQILNSIKNEFPKLNEQESERLEELKLKFPQYLKRD